LNYADLFFIFRFWVGENHERLSNPFVLCLNLVSCKVGITVKKNFLKILENIRECPSSMGL
jgi:hypothetical protein